MQRTARRRTALAALAMSLLTLGGRVLAQDVNLTLLGSVYPGFRIDGFDPDGVSGEVVSGAGDVNGDGLADIILGAPYSDVNGAIDAGQCYVVFGKSTSTEVKLSALGEEGFRLETGRTGDIVGLGVSGAGDVNGDGLSDLIVSAAAADPNGIRNAGETYVVFGKTDSRTVNLAMLNQGGFRIEGIDPNDYSGSRVSGAGDVNGDGLADLVIGAQSAERIDADRTGECYVVFGRTQNTSVSLASLGTGGFQIDGISSFDSAGRSVSGAGDFNGDGLADVVIGAAAVFRSGGNNIGEAYVVFGKTSNSTVSLSSLDAGGVLIEGVRFGHYAGRSVSGAGDVNGDGLMDIIIGAPGSNPGYVVRAGAAYVVFGKTNTSKVRLGQLANEGFRIEGAATDDRLGHSVAGAGDVNGDGYADLMLGARGATANGRAYAGNSYVVFGKANSAAVSVGMLGAGGFRMSGITWYDYSGNSVSGAGDVNGDGLADTLVGAPGADPNGVQRAGESYMVFSAASSPPWASYKSVVRAGNAPRSGVGTSGNGSNDSTPDARAWIDFVDGAAVSLQSVRLIRDTDELSGLNGAAIAAWEITTNRIGWSSAEVTFRYLDSEILGLEERRLEVYTAPSSVGPWTPQLTPINTARNTATVTVSRLGYFAVVSTGPLAVGEWWSKLAD